jgi:hypothetical protein
LALGLEFSLRLLDIMEENNIEDSRIEFETSYSRQELRKKYVDIIRVLDEQRQKAFDGENLEDDVAIDRGESSQRALAFGMLEDCLETIEEIHKNVSSTIDATLDSKALKLTSDLCLHRTKQLYDLNRHHTFNGTDMLHYLKDLPISASTWDSLLLPRELGRSQPCVWSILSHCANEYSKRAVVGLDFLLGPIQSSGPNATGDASSSKRKKTRTNTTIASRSQAPHLLSPEEQSRMCAKNAQEATTTHVKRISHILERVGPIPLMKFVLHPTSFSKTIENVFHCSFLVHEGQASITIDPSGLAILGACERPNDEDYRKGLTRKQFMFEMTMKDWRHALQIFPIDTPIIPDNIESMV